MTYRKSAPHDCVYCWKRLLHRYGHWQVVRLSQVITHYTGIIIHQGRAY